MPGQAEVERTVPYPYEAMEEAIVNAVYHRSYESPPEPIKVYLYPDRMEITSYPGPVPGVKLEHLRGGSIPAVPARNRRIGEFLKDLRLAEGRGTGIPKINRKMRENGSPDAVFDFDEERTYFRVILPVHPRYQVLHALREAAQFWAIGEKDKAISHLERALEHQPGSGALVCQLIEYAFGVERLDKEAKELLRRAIQLCDDNMRKAWCRFDLARTLDWLRSPRSEVEEAYLQALSLLPSESRFKNKYERWKNRSSANKH